jgi:imidazolonepropionase-like amidohydrolase
MGVIAAIRQSVFDAQYYARNISSAAGPDGKRPRYDPALEALTPAIEKKIRVVLEPGSALMVGRAAALARELGLEFALVSCGQEWRRPDLAKAAGATFIVPLNFPTLPKLPDETDWEQVRLDQLRAWDWGPENPALLRQQGLEFALTTHGLADKKKFRQNLQQAIDRGFSESDALAALTTIPSKLCGVENQLGTIERGKFANLTVVNGTNYFDPEAKLRAVWIDGRIYQFPPEEAKTAKAEETKPPKPASPEEGAPKPTPSTKQATNGTAKAESSQGEKPDKKDKKKEDLRQAQRTRLARSPQEGRGPITNPAAILVTNATIWTCGPEGVLTNASLLVRNGRIEQVGSFKTGSLADALTVDGSRLHVTPGLIDCHSHTAILGSVNESTLP